MPQYPWISIEIGCRDKGTEEEATRPTKNTKDTSLHSENQEVHNPIGPTEIPHQEGHASNVDKWVTTPEIAQRRRSRKGSTSLTTMMTNRSPSSLLPYHETMWPQ